MTFYEQQARELADKLVRALTNQYGEAMCQTREDEINTVLRELNLASSLEDKARLDWLNKSGRISMFSDGWNAWIKGEQPTQIHDDVRTAITNAMREQEGK